MSKLDTFPKAIRPYVHHGVELDYHEDKEEAVGDCPFCGRDGKFSVNVETGQWRCFVCNEGKESSRMVQGGNTYTFLRKLHAMGKEDPKLDVEAEALATDRGLLSTDALLAWEVVPSPITGEWMVPGWSHDKKLNQLYRYAELKDKEGGGYKKKLMCTAGMNHQLHGVNLYDGNKPTVYLCEGPWDAMVLWELLRGLRKTGKGKLVPTDDPDASLLSRSNVLAVPGCGVFLESWLGLLEGRDVVILYDNDHPRRTCASCKKSYHTTDGKCSCGSKEGKVSPPAAYEAMRRVCQVMLKSSQPPRSISVLQWGPEGYDPALPSGTDLRDRLTAADTIKERAGLLQAVFDKCPAIPTDWVGTPGKAKEPTLDCVPCDDWKIVINAFRKALRWTDGLDRALSAMLACVISTKAVGDQLWIKVIGPASSGKTTLCEALSVNKTHVLAKSTIRGFHSGFRAAGDDKDHSLVAQLYDKTLVTKDGDTLLSSPNLSQILSEARDLYDSTARTHYRHGMSRDYQGVRMTWILCGTSSLRKLDKSELGERFLDCVIMEEIDSDLEDQILWRAVNRARKDTTFESNGKLDSQYDPDYVAAMQLTGGYIDYLRQNAQKLLATVSMNDAAMMRCAMLGKFVAHMRARPSKTQDETAEREVSFRLAKQLTRFAVCTTAVLGRKEADQEVMRRTTRVALDTARGRSLDVMESLHEAGKTGLTAKAVALKVNETEHRQKLMLRFLRKIGVVEWIEEEGRSSARTTIRWRLTKRMRKLYETVMEYAGDEEEA